MQRKKIRERSKLSKILVKIRNTMLFMIVCVFGGIYIANRSHKPEVIIEEKIIEKKVEVGVDLQNKITELKESVMDDLRHEEIKGHEDKSLVIVFDPLLKDLESCRKVGGVRLHCYSIGDYNFKIATVKHYYLKFFNKTLTDKEAMDVAMDSQLSRELAHKIIFEEIGGIYNWTNSAKKINAIQRIEFIRSLEN